ncbi:transposase domain-containing protein [Paraburkholderia sp.]|uniref:transposase domain-containing protein n=1 Tax=Paraburkholderia sp. TaxID=1926495 RepID=UPI0032C20E81
MGWSSFKYGEDQQRYLNDGHALVETAKANGIDPYRYLTLLVPAPAPGRRRRRLRGTTAVDKAG